MSDHHEEAPVNEEDRKRRDELVQALADREMERLGPARDAVASQLEQLIDRLLAIPDMGDAVLRVPDHMIEPGWVIDPDGTGEIDVWLRIGECRYWLASGHLLVRREFAGRTEWTRVADDGTLDRWEIVAGPVDPSLN